MSAETPSLTSEAIAEQLERILSSAAFRRAERSSSFLRYIIEQTVTGHSDRLKEYTLGSDVLKRGADFDPRLDPIVRAEASRLRARLEEYYSTAGRSDRLVITLPKGGYVPEFTHRPDADASARANEARLHGRLGIPWLAVVFGLGLAVGVAVSLLLPSRNAARNDTVAPHILDIVLMPDAVLPSDVGPSLVLSPDGQAIVFTSIDTERRTRLYYRRLDEAGATPIAGTEGARVPFFSPDGAWIGFWTDGAVKKVPVDGGSPVALHPSGDLQGASWAEDGAIVAALHPTRKLWRISASPGGSAEVILDLSHESALPAWPQVLPGGDLVLFTVHAGAGPAADSSAIEILSIRSGERKVLHRGGTFGRYLANGYLTYVNQGTLYAVRFDLASRSTQGSPVPVIDGVSYSTTFGYAQVDVSKNGTLLYRASAEGAPSILEWLGRTSARSARITTRPGRYAWLAVSPQERYLAYAATDSGATSIEIHDLRRQERRRLSTVTSDHSGLLWWPTGDRLVLGGSRGMTWIDVTSAEQAGVLTTSQQIQVPWSVTRDGSRLAYAQMTADSAFDLWTVPIWITDQGLQAGTPERFLATPGFEVFPAFSPDGQWIAYCSDESGTDEVYIRRFPDNGVRTAVSDKGGCVPKWVNGGGEIVYRTDRQLIVARLHYDGRSWRVESREPWTPRLLADTGVLPNFDLASSDRVAALVPATTQEPAHNQATIVYNFTAAMGRGVATDRP